MSVFYSTKNMQTICREVFLFYAALLCFWLLICYCATEGVHKKNKKYSQTDMASSFPAAATSLLGSAPKRERATHTGGDKRLAPHYTTKEWNATNRLQKKEVEGGKRLWYVKYKDRRRMCRTWYTRSQPIPP